MYSNICTCTCFEANGLVLSDSDPDQAVAKTTHTASRRSVQLLQRYFVEQGVSDGHYAAIDMCADELFRRVNAKMRQATLDSFLLLS